MRHKSIDQFVSAFITYLRLSPTNKDIETTIAAAHRFLQDKNLECIDNLTPRSAPVTQWLNSAIANAEVRALGSKPISVFCDSVKRVLDTCSWHPGYDESEVGVEFKNHFAYATLIGDGGIYPCDYFSAGITLIAPTFFYDWHHHPAIEIYINLTENALWGVNKAPMEPQKVGDVITHPSYVSHAMFSEDAPIIAPWLWAGEVGVPAKMC